MKILYLTGEELPPQKVWTAPFRQALARDGFAVEHLAARSLPASSLLDRLRQTQVLLTSWGSPPLPQQLAADPEPCVTFATSTARRAITSPLRSWTPKSL